jgi:hypothetical protein
MSGRVTTLVRIALHWRQFLGIVESLLTLITEYEKATSKGSAGGKTLTAAEQSRLFGRMGDLLKNLRSLLQGVRG